MQRLVSLKLASNLPKTLSSSTTTFTTSSSLFQFQPHRTFPLTKPPQSLFFSSFPTHPLHHQQHNLTHKVHGFLSNPLLRRHFLLGSANTLLRVSSKRLSDCRLAFSKPNFPNRDFSSSQALILGRVPANIAVFCLWKIADTRFMYQNFTISLFQFTSGRAHALATSAFSHIHVGHIVSNILGLYLFGMNIGRVFGPGFLLKLYLAGAIGGSVSYLVHHAWMCSLPENYSLLLSRSFDHTHPYMIPGLGMFLLGQDFLRVNSGNSTISGSAHLGGATVAAIVWARLRKGRPLV